jgi:hypothetical protein
VLVGLGVQFYDPHNGRLLRCLDGPRLFTPPQRNGVTGAGKEDFVFLAHKRFWGCIYFAVGGACGLFIGCWSNSYFIALVSSVSFNGKVVTVYSVAELNTRYVLKSTRHGPNDGATHWSSHRLAKKLGTT